MKIRTATRNDVPQLAKLMKQLGYPTTMKVWKSGLEISNQIFPTICL